MHARHDGPKAGVPASTRDAQVLPAPAADPNVPPFATAGLTEPQILWAEDNIQDRAFIQDSLDQAAHRGVTLVQDGVVLMQALRQRRPDLVVLDLKMPRLGGMEALRQIRADPEWKSLRVVVFSSGERPDEVAQCRALGVVEVIVKPLDFDLFSSEVLRVARLAAGDFASPGGVSPIQAVANAQV